MIGKNLNEKLSAFQLGSLMFETTNDSQQFLVINMIIAFDWYHAFAIEDHGVKYFFIIVLR